MSDFLTEKNKKTGILGKLKWVLCGFFILFSLGAIGASEKYIGEGRWGMAATEVEKKMPYLNSDYSEYLVRVLGDKFTEEKINWIKRLTGIHKLTYKLEPSIDKEETVYHYLVRSL